VLSLEEKILLAFVTGGLLLSRIAFHATSIAAAA
jgi:hypothetical protein